MEFNTVEVSESLVMALPLSEAVRQRILYHQPLRAAMQYITRHANSPIRLKSAALAANMERTSFCKYFRRKTGIGFCVFVHIVKVALAKRLLRESDRSVALIAFELGYGSKSAFVRNFKRATGLTPMAFRQRTLAAELALEHHRDVEKRFGISV